MYQSEIDSREVSERIGAGEELEVRGLARFPFQLGLDLAGGAHLVYRADVEGIKDRQEREQRMSALRELIERRVNVLGVSEPLVQVERGGITGEGEYRLIVELPGVTDVDEAISAIGETPILEFRLLDENALNATLLDLELNGVEISEGSQSLEEADEDLDQQESDSDSDSEKDRYIGYEWTGLDGSMLNNAQFARHQTTREPIVSITFNREGARLFQEITRDNLGRNLAIFLDGEPISEPVIREEIRGGEAIISGGFTTSEALELAQRLRAGALPVNIELISTQTVGPTLGAEVMQAGVVAGVVGLILVSIFLMLWYRLPGLLAIVALSLYLVIMMTLFKVLPVTLTAAGIAGFILSIGMAVDANILIFERMKEELRNGKNLTDSINDGFARAWLSIRDGNMSSMITAVILYWFGTALVQGFALVFFIGVLISMVSAITVTRTFLIAFGGKEGKLIGLLFGSGFSEGLKSQNNTVKEIK